MMGNWCLRKNELPMEQWADNETHHKLSKVTNIFIMITLKGYKLFAVKDNHLISLVEYWNPSANIGRFSRTRWTEVRKDLGPYCYFDSMLRLMSFYRCIRDKTIPYEIHSIEIELSDHNALPGYYKTKDVYYDRLRSQLPEGTAIAMRFKPIKLIKSN